MDGFDVSIDAEDTSRDSRSDESPTLAMRAYREIRARILDGRYQPGRALRLEPLRNELSIGFSPLREALMWLHGERFVRAVGQKGFQVAPIFEEEFRDLLSTRVPIEERMLVESIARGDDTWEAAILGAFHKLSRRADWNVANGPRPVDWMRAHREFHEALVGAAESPWQMRLWRILYDHGERYHLFLLQRGAEMPNERLDEHRRLMEAALSRDSAIAAEALRTHFVSIGRTLTSHLPRRGSRH